MSQPLRPFEDHRPLSVTLDEYQNVCGGLTCATQQVDLERRCHGTDNRRHQDKSAGTSDSVETTWERMVR